MRRVVAPGGCVVGTAGEEFGKDERCLGLGRPFRDAVSENGLYPLEPVDECIAVQKEKFGRGSDSHSRIEEGTERVTHVGHFGAVAGQIAKLMLDEPAAAFLVLAQYGRQRGIAVGDTATNTDTRCQSQRIGGFQEGSPKSVDSGGVGCRCLRPTVPALGGPELGGFAAHARSSPNVNLPSARFVSQHPVAADCPSK